MEYKGGFMISSKKIKELELQSEKDALKSLSNQLRRIIGTIKTARFIYYLAIVMIFIVSSIEMYVFISSAVIALLLEVVLFKLRQHFKQIYKDLQKVDREMYEFYRLRNEVII